MILKNMNTRIPSNVLLDFITFMLFQMDIKRILEGVLAFLFKK